MTIKRNIAIALATGGLAFASFAPAYANPGQKNAYTHNRGYVSQTHTGYTGQHRGHVSQYQHRGPQHYSSHGNNRYDNRGHHNNRYDNRGHYNNRYDHRGYHNPYNKPAYRPNVYQPRYHWNPHQRVIYAPRFKTHYPNYVRYQPRYRVGHRVDFRHAHYMNDYSRYGLYAPPRGHNWVRHDNDAYLTVVGTGLVAGIVIGALLSN